MSGDKLRGSSCIRNRGLGLLWTGLFIAVSVFQAGAATFTVSNAGDGGAGSLRQAIMDANATTATDTIAFNIPGAGVHTITPTSPLPAITNAVIIDGTTQPGFTTSPLIELNGSSAGSNPGLRLLAGKSIIRGLIINGFGTYGIDVEGPGTNLIKGNFIGTDATGAASRPNVEGILIFDSPGNVIGGTTAADRNLISGNSDAGVYLFSTGSGGNLVQGNFIGPTVTGASGLGNRSHGIVIYEAPGNMIGGSTASARNIISGNGGSGVYLYGTGSTANLMQGNYVGTDVSGTVAVRNSADGVTLTLASANSIGGTDAGAGNVISGNLKAGIFLNGPGVTTNLVQGNLIGTTASGTATLGNGLAGVTLSAANGNLIGGVVPEARNIISGNQQDGIFVTSNSLNNTIAANYIGTDNTGSNAVPNLYNGISIGGAGSNVIGGTVAAARNLISGNASYGIELFSGAAANLIQGNYLGTKASGRVALPNQFSGVSIESPRNIVGGATAGARNVISGNTLDGIYLAGAAASSNVIQGNFIGTGPSGSEPLGNGRGGVGLSAAPFNTIGGASSGAGNVVSANGDAAIYLLNAGVNGNLIQGNVLGSDVNGALALGNAFEGIYALGSFSNTIGGSVPGAGNLIAANGGRGVWLNDSSWNVVQGNLIGTKSDGTSALGNAQSGVECDVGATNNTIGGAPGAGNRIGFSQGGFSGVRVRNGATNAINNRIVGNAIFSNSGFGIDLGLTGISANDPCDGDTGANFLQNYPVLIAAVSKTGTLITGNLNSTAGNTFLLQFFASPACSPSGYGEGQIYLGEKTVVTGGDCNVHFSASFSNSFPVGYVITATATDSANNSSEFSACVPVQAPPTLRVAAAASHQVILSWTNTATGFVLKQTASLSPPITWSTVTNVPGNINGQFVVMLPASASKNFYGLSLE